MRKREMAKRLLCLCLASLMLLSLAACKGKGNAEDDNTASAQPTVKPTEVPPTPEIPFTDVSERAYYYDAVKWALKNGIADGTSDTTFEPDALCTRGQVITFIWRAMGSPKPQITENPISDISPADEFYEAALWAYENGIAASTTFKPDNDCTNGDALTFLWRAVGKPIAIEDSSFVARSFPGKYYTQAVAWAENNGVFSEMRTLFDPTASCTRGDMVMFLYWATEQWSFPEDEKTVQAEYEQILNSARPYEFFGTGLVYADYVDLDGDGKVELLTVGIGEDKWRDGIITVYANINGHAQKSCEGTYVTNLGNRGDSFSLCKLDGQLYLYSYSAYVEGAGAYYRYMNRLYKIGKEAVALEHKLDCVEEAVFDTKTSEYLYTKDTYTDFDKEITESEFNAILQRCIDDKSLYTMDSYAGGVVSISERGLLPTPRIEVDGTAVKLSATAYLSVWDDVLMVPLRDVLEAMGVAVYANSDASVILASTKSDTLLITCEELWHLHNGINDITADGRKDKTYQYSMNNGTFQDITVEFNNGKAFVPLQVIVPLFGGKAEWDGKAGAMQITSNISDSSRMTQDEVKQMANFGQEQAQQLAFKKIQAQYNRIFFFNNDGSTYGHFAFKHGKMVWMGDVPISEHFEWNEYGEPVAMYYEVYPIEVASDGTVTTHPNDINRRYSSQF